MGMLLHRHYAEPAPEKPVQEPMNDDAKDEAATAKKPGRPKKTE